MLLDEREHGIERAANLERKRRLQRFELEEDISAACPRQPLRPPQRCAENTPFEPASRRAERVDGNQEGDGAAARRISASRAAKAERAITSSIPACRA